MDSADIKVLETKLESIARRLDDGFSGIDKRLDAMSLGATELEARVRTLEIHGSSESIRRTETLENQLSALDHRLDQSERDAAAEKIKMKWLVALVSGGVTVVGELLGHFIK